MVQTYDKMTDLKVNMMNLYDSVNSLIYNAKYVKNVSTYLLKV